MARPDERQFRIHSPAFCGVIRSRTFSPDAPRGLAGRLFTVLGAAPRSPAGAAPGPGPVEGGAAAPRPPAGARAVGRDAVATLQQRNAEVRRALPAFPAEWLDELLIAESPYSAHTHFVGLTQHDVYHAGQIALLKRALADRDPGESLES